MDLQKIRKRIDRIDNELLGLVAERMELAMRARRFKTDVADGTREAHVLGRARMYSRASASMRNEFVEKLFVSLMEESRALQDVGNRLIGFQGEHGAFSEGAAKKYDPASIPIPCPQFTDVFDGVESGALDSGIVPVENSLAGPVVQVGQLLAETPLKIAGALKFQVNHCLLKLPETDHRDIRKVYSHPQALAQCKDFLTRHQIEGIPYYDTAGAARMLAVERPAMTAVIAAASCADYYGLEILKENVQDVATNITRFLILSKEGRTEGADICSTVFSVPHEAGALFGVLKIFAEKGINLTRIESFMRRDGKGSYSFFLDFQCDDILRVSPGILKTLEQQTTLLKNLGCYRESGPD